MGWGTLKIISEEKIHNFLTTKSKVSDVTFGHFPDKLLSFQLFL